VGHVCEAAIEQRRIARVFLQQRGDVGNQASIIAARGFKKTALLSRRASDGFVE
jgi:hypothetical protein